MPKVVPLSKYLPTFTSNSGTFTDISYIEVDSVGRITSITTSSISSAPVQGNVLSVNGDNSTTVVSTATGNIQLNLAYAGSSTGTIRAVNSITVDSYGRVSSATTSTYASGTYTNVSSITIDSNGKITQVVTTSSSVLNFNDLTFSNAGSNYFGNIFNGIMYINNVQETITTSTSQSSYLGVTTYTIPVANGTIAYIDSPTENFSFYLTDPYPTSTFTNSFAGRGSYGAATYTVIVNNTNGKSYTRPRYANYATVGLPGWPIILSINEESNWLGSARFPQGTSGKIEVYTFIVPTADHQSSYASMASFG